MKMKPGTRYVSRVLLVGVAAMLASLQGNLPGIDSGDIMSSFITGALLALSYAGIGAATPLEPSVGLGK